MRLLSSFIAILVCFWVSSARAAGRSDYEPVSPSDVDVPAAGGAFVDPDFGTTLIRATDASYGEHCYHAYSYWQAFNADTSRLLLACDDRPLLFRFDPSTDSLTPDGVLWGDDGAHVDWQGATWSASDPNVLYALDLHELKLWRIDVSQRGAAGYSLVRDFSDQWSPDDVLLNSLTVSDGADVFGFRVLDRWSGAPVDAVVYDAGVGALHVFPHQDDYTLNEIMVDKHGDFAQVKYDDETTVIWAFRYGDETWLRQYIPFEDSGGHYDVGQSLIANTDAWSTGIAVRSFAALSPARNVVQYLRSDGSLNWTLCDHVSLRPGAEDFLVGSTYGGDGSWSAFEKEIYLAYTDGRGFVRLAHSRSSGEQGGVWRYWSQPRAVVSRDGHYAVFTTDLGSWDRTDVVILKIPPELWP